MPEKSRDRRFYQHNPTVTLMRTTAEENAQIGEEIARKVAASSGPATIMLPLKGVSAIGAEGQFVDPVVRFVRAEPSHPESEALNHVRINS